MLVDTSVWIDYLRDAPTPPAERLDRLLGQGRLLLGDVILLEVLRGARDSICHCWMGFIDQKACTATLQATFDGQKWLPTATLEGRQLAFESDKFAYRLTDGAGTIRFTPANAMELAKLAINLTAVAGGQRTVGGSGA